MCANWTQATCGSPRKSIPWTTLVTVFWPWVKPFLDPQNHARVVQGENKMPAILYLGGGFKYVLFSTLPGEMTHFD